MSSLAGCFSKRRQHPSGPGGGHLCKTRKGMRTPPSASAPPEENSPLVSHHQGGSRRVADASTYPLNPTNPPPQRRRKESVNHNDLVPRADARGSGRAGISNMKTRALGGRCGSTKPECLGFIQAPMRAYWLVPCWKEEPHATLVDEDLQARSVNRETFAAEWYSRVRRSAGVAASFLRLTRSRHQTLLAFSPSPDASGLSC